MQKKDREKIIAFAQQGNFSEIKTLIQKNKSLVNVKETKNKSNQSPLISLILANQPEKPVAEIQDIVDFLILQKVDCGINAANNIGLLPLHYACILADGQLIKKIASQNKEVIHNPSGTFPTPLHLFVEYFKIKFSDQETNDLFRFLLSNSKRTEKKIYTPKNFGSTIAHIVAAFGSEELLKILEEQKLDHLFFQTDDHQWLPIHEAAQTGNISTLEYLFKKNPDSLNKFNANEENVALIAAKSCNFEIIKFVLKNGKKTLAARNIFNKNILHLIFQSHSPTNKKIFIYLNDNYPELIKLMTHLLDKKNLTPLDEAIQAMNHQSILCLLEYAAPNRIKISADTWFFLCDEEDRATLGLLLLAGYDFQTLPAYCLVRPDFIVFFEEAQSSIKNIFDTLNEFIRELLCTSLNEAYQIKNPDNQTPNSLEMVILPMPLELLLHIIQLKLINDLQQNYYTKITITDNFFKVCLAPIIQNFIEKSSAEYIKIYHLGLTDLDKSNNAAASATAPSLSSTENKNYAYPGKFFPENGHDAKKIEAKRNSTEKSFVFQKNK
jgi:ankyrin repeat protein